MSFLPVLVAHAANFQIKTGIPGQLDPANYGLLGYIQNGYLLALGLAGLLAFGSIVYGAFQYTVSRGNPSKLSDAWDRILQALIGIVLLVGAGTILRVINPGLLSLELPKLQPVADVDFSAETFSIPPEDTPEVSDDDPNAGTGGRKNIPPTSSCNADKTKCATYKSAGFQCYLGSRCTAHQNVLAAVGCAADKLGIPRNKVAFSSGYPPSSYKHQDPGHSNGCSQDMVIDPAYMKNCDQAKAFVNAVAACGYEALNEYAYGAFAGCGSHTKNANGRNHMHIYGCAPGTK